METFHERLAAICEACGYSRVKIVKEIEKLTGHQISRSTFNTWIVGSSRPNDTHYNILEKFIKKLRSRSQPGTNIHRLCNLDVIKNLWVASKVEIKKSRRKQKEEVTEFPINNSLYESEDNINCPSNDLKEFFLLKCKKHQRADRIEEFHAVKGILELIGCPVPGNGLNYGWHTDHIKVNVLGRLKDIPAIQNDDLKEKILSNPPNKKKYVFCKYPYVTPDNEGHITFNLKETDYAQTVLSSKAIGIDPKIVEEYGDWDPGYNLFPYGTSIELLVILKSGEILICYKGIYCEHEGGKWSISTEETLDETDIRYCGEEGAIRHLADRAVAEEIFSISTTPPTDTECNHRDARAIRNSLLNDVRPYIKEIRVWNVFYKLDYSSVGFCGIAHLGISLDNFSNIFLSLKAKHPSGRARESSVYVINQEESIKLSQGIEAKCFSIFDQNTVFRVRAENLTHTSLFRLRFYYALINSS